MTSTRAAMVWRTVHCSLLLAVLVAGTSRAPPRHRLRSSAPTKIDFWSAYEEAINRFGHVGSSSSGSGQGTRGVKGQEGSKAHEPAQEINNYSSNSVHQPQYMYLGLNHKGHLNPQRPEDDEFKNRLVELKVKHIQDLLGHSQTRRTQQISVPNNLVKDSTSVDDGLLEQRPLGVIESQETDPVMSNGSVPPSSDSARYAVKDTEKKVVKRRRKPASDAGESLARSPRPRLTVTDDVVTTNTDDSVSALPVLASSLTPTPVEDRQQRTSTRAEGTTNEDTANKGTTDEATPIDGTTDDTDKDTTNEDTTDEGTTNEGTADGATTNESTTNEGTNDEGTTDEGTIDERTTDEGTTDEGTTNENSADESTTDRTSDRAVYNTSSDYVTTDRATHGDSDNITDDKISDSTTSINNTYDGDDGNTTIASNKSNSNDLKKSGQTTDSKDSIDHKSSPANSSSPLAQQLSGPTQLWPNSQDAGDGFGADLEAGVVDSIIASVIKIQGNFNETFPGDTPTNAPDEEDDTAKFKSPLLVHPNGTSVLQDASSSNGSVISNEIQHVQRENNSVSLLRAETTDNTTSPDKKSTALGTQSTRDITNSTTTPVPRVAVPPETPFTPPVRTDLFALAQAASQVGSAASSSSSVQSEEQLSQYDYVVRAVQNPSRMTAAFLDVANSVVVVGGIMSLPFLLPFLIGKRRRRRDAEDVFGISREVVDRDLTPTAIKTNFSF